MNFSIVASRWIALFERMVAATANPRHGRRVMLLILLAYVAVWTVYAVVAKATQGIHPDMAEIFSWGWNLEWGTPKHPPFLPALVSLWFSIFPVSDWAYYLLGVLSTSVAIYFAWLVSGFWLHGAKRAAVPFLLMLIPFYNFLALKLDHNVILIPLWAMTTYAFVKAFDTRSPLWSVATGILAGLAVLAKYWSVFLLLGLASAALADRERLSYLKCWSPWIITIVSFGVFLPHLVWLEANHFPTFLASRHRLADTAPDMAWHLLGYVQNSIAYVAAPLIAVAVLASPSRAAILDTLFPQDQKRRFAAVIFWVPLLAAIPFAIAMQVRLTALWSMSALSLLGVVLLSSPLVQFNRRSAAVVASFAVVVSVGALLASPLVAIAKLQGGIENHAAYTRGLAKEVQSNWEQATSAPLQIVESVFSLTNSVTFYLKKKTLPVWLYAVTHPRWDTPETLDRFGGAVICPAASPECRARMAEVIGSRLVARHAEVKIQPRWFGIAGEPRSFVIDIVPPQTQGQARENAQENAQENAKDNVQDRTDEDTCCVGAAKRTKPPLP